jgi:hypothetical protein
MKSRTNAAEMKRSRSLHPGRKPMKVLHESPT